MSQSAPRNRSSEKLYTAFAYSVVGVTLPLILSIIAILVIGIELGEFVAQFINDGNLLLFSAGFYTSAIYIFRRDDSEPILKKPDRVWTRVCSHLAYLLLICASVIYAIVFALNISHDGFFSGNSFVCYSSIILLILALIISYCSVSIEIDTYSQENPGKARSDEVQNLVAAL